MRNSREGLHNSFPRVTLGIFSDFMLKSVGPYVMPILRIIEHTYAYISKGQGSIVAHPTREQVRAVHKGDRFPARNERPYHQRTSLRYFLW